MEQESSDERGDSVRVDTDKESAFIERRKLVAQFHRHLNYSVFGLSLLAIPVGIAAAYGAWAFGAAVGSLGFLFRGESTVIGNVFHLIELATAGLLFGIVLHFLKWERFRTPAHVIVASAENGGRMRLRDGFITSVADATALALAAPVGRYGPAVNLGATIGSVFGQWMRLGETSVRILLGCGVAGAISAAFNAPIAGVIFAHEVIIGHFKLRAFAPVTLASVAAVAVTRHHGIEYEALKLPSALHPVTPEDYPIFLGLGFFMALVAMVYMSGIVGAAGVARRLRIPKWLQPMIGGTLAGLVGLWMPTAMGLGDETIFVLMEQDVRAPQFGIFALLLLALAKLIASVSCLGLRFPGGAFSPAMLVGGAIGGAFGLAIPALDYQISVLVGTGAMTAAVIGAPLSVILIVFELTENYQAATGVMVAVVAANAMVTRFFSRSLFHRQIRVLGIEINQPGEQRILAKRTVGELCFRDVATIHGSISLEDARGKISRFYGRTIFVIDDSKRLLGTLPEINWESADPEKTLAELALMPEVVFIRESSQWAAFEKMENTPELTAPVVESEEDPTLVGTISTARLLGAYREAIREARKED